MSCKYCKPLMAIRKTVFFEHYEKARGQTRMELGI